MSFAPDMDRLQPALAERRRRERPNILLVEDHKLFRQLIANIVGERFDIHNAHDGMEALNLYQNLAPDITFLDIQMPRLNGLEVLQHIMAMDPDSFVVMISGSVREQDQADAERCGAKGYISKPFTPSKIEEYLDLYWEKRSAA